jgi:MoxR-like ATPase
MTAHDAIIELKQRIGQSIIGQDLVVERLLLTLLCNGNVLVEGLPGLAKTRAVKSLAKNLEADFSRIQFTPDLLPSDITGSEMYLGEEAKERFLFQPGPIFANIVLADEVNRAPAKVQAALLEAMEERQITVAKKTHKLPPLFMVMATQNPIEQEGTYPLPEAQMDRFLMHIFISYPDDAAERDVIRLVRNEVASGETEEFQSQKVEESKSIKQERIFETSGDKADGSQSRRVEESKSIKQETIFEARAEIQEVQISEPMENYIVSLVAATRRPREFGEELAKYIQVGVSPRGSIALDKCSRAYAWLQGSDHVTPDDIRAVISDCLRHRIILSYEASADGITTDDVISMLVKLVAVA